MLYKVVLSFESMDEILKWDHSHQTYCVERPCHGYRTVHMNVHTVEPRKIELLQFPFSSNFSKFTPSTQASFCFLWDFELVSVDKNKRL